MAIQYKKHKKTFSMWSKLRTDSTKLLSISFTITQNGVIFSMLTLSGPAFSVFRQDRGGGGLRGLDAKNQG